MRKTLGVIIALMLSSCAALGKPDVEIEKTVNQHNVILNAMVNYVRDLQAKGFLPTPDKLEKAQVKKSK